MEKILEIICKKNDYKLSEEIRKKINLFFENEINKKDENFSNGRLARNIYDDLVMNHAKRVVKMVNVSKDDLSLIIDEDFKV